ncbi:hypothetical protein Mapa_017466 [Marchantia paleacea]|nr:hypothetical protein Mapa_017466 [Marchantia paleacea]
MSIPKNVSRNEDVSEAQSILCRGWQEGLKVDNDRYHISIGEFFTNIAGTSKIDHERWTKSGQPDLPGRSGPVDGRGFSPRSAL